MNSMSIGDKTRRENEARVAEEYYSSLSDLNCNSKPLINMLTMLAEENIEYAPIIVKVVGDHISKVPPDIKLPILYLIDSIVKNVKNTYTQLFSQCIVNIFCDVFEKVNEKIRERMYALRQTWNEVFSPQKLYTLDVRVKQIDSNWPITAKQPQPSIHVNPNFLVAGAQARPTEMEEILHVKTRELLELKKRKLELELEATKKHLEEQEKQLSKTTETMVPVPGVGPATTTSSMNAANLGAPLSDASDGMRPKIFNSNSQFRNANKSMITESSSVNAPVIPQQLESHTLAHTGTHTSKQKVYPVQPGLLNTLRHRDPRLARQQQTSQQSGVGERGKSSNSSNQTSSSGNLTRQVDEDGVTKNKDTSLSQRSSHKSTSSRSRSSKTESGSESKSPTRHSPSRSSSGRAGKSYSSRDKVSKDRNSDRKRSDSKSSSSSAASSGTSLDRRKTNTSLSGKGYDKDAFEIVPLATAMAHKASCSSSAASNQNPSPSSTTTTTTSSSLKPSSPTASSSANTAKHKLNANKRTQQQQFARNSNNNNSSSSTGGGGGPIGGGGTSGGAGDNRHKNARIESPDNINPNKDIDLRKSIVASVIEPVINSLDTADSNKQLDLDAAAVIAAQPSTSLSFVDKTSAVSALERHSNNRDMEDHKTAGIPWTERLNMSVDDSEDQCKKRPSNSFEENEPATKKCKAASKIDILFGEEDVDLRTLPGQIIVQQQHGHAPPPPSISEKDKREVKLKPHLGGKSQQQSLRKSHFEDVRAKLAKAAKSGGSSGKTRKSEKVSNRELHQPTKSISDVNMNEDTQDNNDEKIRTIVTQAQELLETKSISQEQYKNLVQTVMSINENNKLNEAKRRESLTVNKTKHETAATDDNDDENSNDSEIGRREAVLKKRIPKLTKAQQADAVAVNDTRNTKNMSFFEPAKSENTDGNSIGKMLNTNNKKDKPLKMKWNERSKKNQNADMSGAGGNPMNSKAAWLMGNSSKIGMNRFAVGNSGGAANQVPPPMVHANQRIPPQQLQLPWSMQSTVPPPPTAPAPMPMLCNGMLAPPPQPALPGVMGIAAAAAIPPMTKPCNSIDNPQADMVRSIKIDNMAKEIRIYDEVAIVFMELDQPREIGFKVGKRDVYIDNQEPITLHFNDAYRSFNIAGQPHRLRFGFPSRELYIDDNWYEIYFGGPPALIPLGNSVHCLKAEGPPPQVNIGPLRRDLVVGKINMIVDAHIVVPLFLDSKLQTFYLGEKQHSVQFADNLLTVLLDGEPIQVEYGGLPKKYMLSGTKYFIRFGTLPQGIVAGKVKITNMIYVKTAPPILATEPFVADTPMVPPALDTMEDIKDVHFVNPITTNAQDLPNDGPSTTTSLPSAAAMKNLNIDDIFQKLVSYGILSTNTTSTAKNTAQDGGNSAGDKLAGTKPITAAVEPAVESTEREIIVPIELNKPESVKTRQVSIVNRLFTGMQCSSCGLRFSLEHTIKYSQHLDWHFRQNRRERDTSRKAHSRKWYYDFSEWVQYEEIEDVEEKEKNFFETQQNDIESNDETSINRVISGGSPVQSCPAGPNDLDRVCDVCQEKFEQFYHEELEEWHLRTAIRVEDKIYHPLCYNDLKASIAAQQKKVEKEAAEDVIMTDVADVADDNATDILIGLDGNDDNNEDVVCSDVISADDAEDDDVIVLPNEEPLITEIDDDDDDAAAIGSKQPESTAVDIASENVEKPMDTSKDTSTKEFLNDTAESDVEIQEPHIPFTDLDTYVEKELPLREESSQGFFADIKIKEEPKEDDEEDDGFEDVGTVLMPCAEEIILQEESTQSIEPSARTDSPINGSPLLNSKQVDVAGCDITTKEPTITMTDNAKDPQVSMDGNLESEIEHNLSATGMLTPAIPLASLVNKIKINITKNTALNSSDAASTSSSSLSSATIAGVNQMCSSSKVIDNSNDIISDTTSTSLGSTIPVLCSGSSTTTAISNIPTIGAATNGHGIGSIDAGSFGTSSTSTMLGSVSTISVIGSYGTSSIGNTAPETQHHLTQTTSSVTSVASSANTQQQQQQAQPAVPTITYELKPSLKEATLKKTPSVSCGVETSGLCSIM